MKTKFLRNLILGLGVTLLGCLTFGLTKTQAKDAEGNIVVILDAGHGGADGGACYGGVQESDLNYAMAQALKAELETYAGVRVYMTRNSAEYFSNSGRGMFGENMGADVFISCHNNANGNPDPHGVYVYSTADPRYKQDMINLGNRICQRIAAVSGFANNGCQQRGGGEGTNDPNINYYTVLCESNKVNIPGLIIEHGFVSNDGDRAYLAVKENQYKLGAADATAIAEYYGLKKRTVDAGKTIDLIRSYSAYMQAEGTFVSSNEGVCIVRSDGLITAVGEGQATITCTTSGGKKKTVTVNVPAVQMLGIRAGLNPTFYADDAAVANYNRNNVIIKAYYSDGSVKQIAADKVTQGAMTDAGNGKKLVPISYKGFSCNLHIYVHYYLSTQGTSTGPQMSGSNIEMLIQPQIYAGVNDGSNSSGGPGYVEKPTEPYVEPTQAPTEPPTQTEAPTPAPTEPETEPETVTETEPETESESETETETETKTESETTTEAETETEETTTVVVPQKQTGFPIWIIIIIAVVLIAGIGVGIFFLWRSSRRK